MRRNDVFLLVDETAVRRVLLDSIDVGDVLLNFLLGFLFLLLLFL